MPSPQYLEPQYITYEMIAPFLGTVNVSLVPVDPTSGAGIYIEDVKTLIAMAESDVIVNVLSNYLEIPLQSDKGIPFVELYAVPKVNELSYIPLRNMFINCALWYVLKSYYASGGNAMGQALTKNALDRYNADKVAYGKLDNATNPQLKNVFFGMKLAPNFSQRQPSGCIVPNIPTGEPQGNVAIGSVPDFFTGFNR